MIAPLPPRSRIWRESMLGGRWVPNHQARRELANKCIRLINADRKAGN
jgi:hypothetical protein